MSIKTTVKYKNGAVDVLNNVVPLFNLDDDVKSLNWSDINFNIQNPDDPDLVEDILLIEIEFLEDTLDDEI